MGKGRDTEKDAVGYCCAQLPAASGHLLGPLMKRTHGQEIKFLH